MEEFNLFALILAGLVATFVKNIFMFLFGLLTRTSMQPIVLLGTLATMETGKKGQLSSSRKAFIVGMLIYYAVGIFIALFYGLLWNWGIGSPEIIDTFIFGFFTGILALAGWSLLLNYHSKPPKLRLADHFSPLLIGHVIFALNFLYFYILFK